MGSFKNVKKGTKVGLFVFLALSVALFVYQVINLAAGGKVPFFVVMHVAALLVLIVAILLYVFVLYKKPHGNLLRYLFFFFGLYLAFQGTVDFQEANLFVPGCVNLLAALIVTYVSGRLNKIEKNQPLLLLVGVLLLIHWILYTFVCVDYFKIDRLFGSLGDMIYLGALGFSYVARYEEHKAAGLEDK